MLTRFGFSDVAYTLLLQDTYPSWLYPVTMGATTIWERWDGERPDSTFQTPGMNSFNHYAYGAIGDWMYRKMVGLDTYDDGVGYKHIKVLPHIGGGFTQAEASLKTYYGTAKAGWTIDGDNVILDVSIPSNTTATIYIPANAVNAVSEAGNALQGASKEDDYVVTHIGSGKYHFVSKGAAPANANVRLEDFTGEYKVENAMITAIKINMEDGKLVVHVRENSGRLSPVATEKDVFTSPNGTKVYFSRDSSHKVVKVKMEDLGMKYEGTKN